MSNGSKKRRHPVSSRTLPLAVLAGAALASVPVLADPAPFELAGPDLAIEVTRGGRTLPIARVPSLAAGDRLVIRAALPKDQDAEFLLVSAFLRGATNPPPKDWIDTAKTWKSKDKDRTLTLVVPEGARQAVLLMVPETGGAEGVLVDAVRGKPGEFVRASQDLNQASLDHSRLEAFMAAIRAQDDNGPEYLRTVAPVLARSLSIKLQEDCLSKVIELQASCLVQNRDALVLNDVHTSSLADTLTGTPTDLALQLSATREAGGGYYSPYIAVARDVARIFGAFNNPQFNYLPTLSVRHDATMGLLLNAAPSFKKPKSVMVAALPAIEADIPPQLRSTADGPICAAGAAVVLPVEGAPLVFSTDFAHDAKVRLTSSSGQVQEVPATARADKGGFVIAAEALPAAFTGTVRAHLHGQWGFAAFDGPDFVLQRPDAGGWKLAGDPEGLIVGRDNDIVLEGAAPSCVEAVTLRQANGSLRTLPAKPQGADKLAVRVPLEGAQPGTRHLEVRERGAREPAVLALKARTQASRIEAITLHSGDAQGTLSGQRLDQVQSVTVGSLEMRPDGLTRDGGADRLRLVVQGSGRVPEAGAAPDKALVRLADGRTLTLPLHVAPPRPRVEVLSRTLYPGPGDEGGRRPDLVTGDLLRSDGELVFSVKAGPGTKLGARDVLEVALDGGETVARLSAGKGLVLESADVAVATLRAADLPPASFGPLRFRLVRMEDGREQAGDWLALTTLARLPRIEAVSCGSEPAGACTIRGRDLFLIQAVAADDAFGQATSVPQGFTGASIQVPRPGDGKLRLRLRDAPAQTVTLGIG
ncbi:hypothetical protein [Novosphingobium soli]|uniref:Uncharacterized protein n=1 Tax=Novosphingobium soli TaxID=574956 RepID=A0ABV6CU80_9SPHN